MGMGMAHFTTSFFDSGFVKIARHIINLECTIIGINLLLFVLILANLSQITNNPWPQAVLLICCQTFLSKMLDSGNLVTELVSLPAAKNVKSALVRPAAKVQ